MNARNYRVTFGETLRVLRGERCVCQRLADRFSAAARGLFANAPMGIQSEAAATARLALPSGSKQTEAPCRTSGYIVTPDDSAMGDTV